MAKVFRLTDASGRLIDNPIFDKWTSGSLDDWSEVGSPTVEQSTTNVRAGVYSAKITGDASAGLDYIYQDISNGITSGQTYVVSIWVYVESGTVNLVAYDGGTTSNGQTATASSTGWRRLLVQKTAADNGIRVALSTTDATDVGYFDDVRLGTTEVEFLDAGGFDQDETMRLTEWQPAIPDYKGGGVWRSSPITDGRQLVAGWWETTEDSITFRVDGSTDQDTTITATQNLLRLLVKANNYRLSRWQQDPVYVTVKAGDETELRYALVEKARWPEMKDPFGIEFEQLEMVGQQLQLWHGHWSHLPPGVGLGTSISALETYDGRNYGNVDSSGNRQATAEREVYVANKRAKANITHVHLYDGSSTWTLNRQTASLPYTILDTQAAGAATYFGITTSLSNSGPFSSIVLDVGTVASGTYSVTWEYYNGSSWQTLTVQDNTDSFANTGVNSVHWAIPPDWATVNLNVNLGGTAPSVTGYWVRARVDSRSGTTVDATQQNRDIYAVMWPYVEIQASEISGDIPAVTEIKVYGAAGNVTNAGQSNDQRESWGIFAGLRSYDRGSRFTAFVNLSDEQNPSGISLSGNGSYVTNTRAPSGRALRFSTSAHQHRIQFDTTIGSDFSGTYRMFVRHEIADPFTKSVAVDFGRFVIPDYLQSFSINIGWYGIDDELTISLRDRANSNTVSSNVSTIDNTMAYLDLYDLILIPVDEWSYNTYDQQVILPDATVSVIAPGVAYYHLESFEDSPVLVAKNESDDTGLLQLPLHKNGTPILQANTRQRLWFFLLRTFGRTGPDSYENVNYPSQSVIVQIYHVNRYLSMRGSE